MPPHCLQDRTHVGGGQEYLEDVAAHDREVEALGEDDTAGIALNPAHPVAARTPARHGQHGLRRIEPGDGVPALGQGACQLTGTAADIHDPL